MKRNIIVSIDFSEFKIDGIFTPTKKMLPIKDKKHANFGILILSSTSNILVVILLCRQFDACESQLKRYNHVFYYPHWIKNSFAYGILFWTTEFSLFKKQKLANLLWKKHVFSLCFPKTPGLKIVTQYTLSGSGFWSNEKWVIRHHMFC